MKSRMSYRKAYSLTVALLALVLGSPGVVFAQGEAGIGISILPPDGARFLAGAEFDLRIEIIGTESVPEDFAVTVNGEDADAFFGIAGVATNYATGPSADPVPVAAMSWPSVSLVEPGEYTLRVNGSGLSAQAIWRAVRGDPRDERAYNVILLVADGLSPELRAAARVVSRGPGGLLAMDTLDYNGALITECLDSMIGDPACTATAFNTGHKVQAGSIGVYSDSSPSPVGDPRLQTFGEMIHELRGMSVGVVTTGMLTDGGASAVYAHVGSQDAHPVIAEQIGDWRPEVLLGGGMAYFWPEGERGSLREDDRDLFHEYRNYYWTVVNDVQLAGAGAQQHLIGYFHNGPLDSWLDRHMFGPHPDFPGQPDLARMFRAALQVLGQNRNGFYLVVHAGGIGYRLRDLDWERAIADTIEFDEAVAMALDFADRQGNTLVIVTATVPQPFAAYGTIDLDALAAEHLGAIRVGGGAGFPDYVDANGDHFPDEWDVARPMAVGWGAHPPYREDYRVNPAQLPPAVLDPESGRAEANPDRDPDGMPYLGNLPPLMTAGVYIAGDVMVGASGPGAECFGRTMGAVDLFFCMAAAVALDPTAPDGVVPAPTPEGTSGSRGGTSLASYRSSLGYAHSGRPIGDRAMLVPTWLVPSVVLFAALVLARRWRVRKR